MPTPAPRARLVLACALAVWLLLGVAPTASAVPAPVDPAGADPALVQPWPQAYHDARRTSSTPFLGPHVGRRRVAYGERIAGSPSHVAAAASGRAFQTLSWCRPRPIIGGCESTFSTLAVLGPAGGLWLPRLRGGVEYGGDPAVGADGTVYVASELGLEAMHQDGRRRWLAAGLTGSVLLRADGLILVHGTGLAVVTPDGAVRGSRPLPTGLDAPFTPLAIGPDGGIYYGSVGRELIALAPSGEPRWRFPTGDQMHAPPSIGPDGTIYAGGNRLYAVRPDGSLRWDYRASHSFSGDTAAIAPSGAIILRDADAVVALAPDGTERWRFPLAGVGRSVAIDRDGTTYAHGRSAVVAITPAGAEQWRHTGLDLPFDARLAIGAGRILFVAARTATFAIGP